MSDIVYCKDCAYAEPNNLDAYHAVKFGVFCTRYKQNTIGIHGCDNGKPKPQTNADRIRAMSDEELAKTISGDQIYPWCTEEPCKYDSCTDCVLAWLKQEAET